tara:strand:- start:326 stop:664 length:339 start_codon:yes stop_codon:yes gene_type:complete
MCFFVGLWDGFASLLGDPFKERKSETWNSLEEAQILLEQSSSNFEVKRRKESSGQLDFFYIYLICFEDNENCAKKMLTGASHLLLQLDVATRSSKSIFDDKCFQGILIRKSW